jgi:TRAP-type mannitol/chloroaromatic compound transport system permease large subunit
MSLIIHYDMQRIQQRTGKMESSNMNKISWKVIGTMLAIDVVIIGIVWVIITGVGIMVIEAGLLALSQYSMYRAIAWGMPDKKLVSTK